MAYVSPFSKKEIRMGCRGGIGLLYRKPIPMACLEAYKQFHLLFTLISFIEKRNRCLPLLLSLFNLTSIPKRYRSVPSELCLQLHPRRPSIRPLNPSEKACRN